MDLKRKIKMLPEQPGVYLMKDFLGNIIYVGKSKNLRNRVSQYFQSSKNHSPKVIEMINNIHTFDYIVTDTELEALLLECSMIKDIKPIYNRLMKNDKRYSYIEVTLNEEFPRVMISSDKLENGSKYFGPYTSIGCVETTVSFINDRFSIRRCNNINIIKTRNGCLNYHLGFCMGICRGTIGRDQYMEHIQMLITFLEGKDKNIVKELEENMKDAACKLDFNKASKYRDEISAIRHVLNKQEVIRTSQRRNNILAVEFMNKESIKIFFITGNRLHSKNSIDIYSMSQEDIREQLKCLIHKDFGDSIKAKARNMSKKDIDEAQIIYSYLKRANENTFYIRIPATWLKEAGQEKLNKGIDKLTDKIYNH